MIAQMNQPQAGSSTDRIEKHVTLRASRARVWRALADAKEFGTWFGMNVDGAFAVGATVHGKITNPKFAEVKPFEMRIERMDAERHFAYRWHPYAIDPKIDYSAEPMTLVEFILEDATDGVALTIIESGFDRIPAARRDEALRMNEGGWNGQIKNIVKHVS